MNIIKFVLICTLALLICGCVNYEQETYLNPDLSGRIEMHLFPNPKPMTDEIMKKIDDGSQISTSLREAFSKEPIKMKMTIKEENLLEGFNREAIKNKNFRKVDENGTTHYYMTIEFDDIRKLFTKEKQVIVAENNGEITYTEYFEQSKEKKEEGKDGKDTLPEIFKGLYFKYTLHMPGEIARANTISISKNTAIWELPLNDIMKIKDFHITATSKRRP